MADQIKAVFLAALDTPAERRPAYVDQACGGDAELRRRVEALLRAHEGPDWLLDRPAWCPTPGQDAPGPGPAAPPLTPEQGTAGPAPGADRAGRVHLLGEIARGGMGAVLRGHDPELGRELAVKVILPAHRDNAELVRRFVGEARLAGQLQHPGIMPVYDVGHLTDGRPFFTMKLVQGRTLAELLAGRPGLGHDLPRVLRYFEATCQAVGYAHAHGVIHRDLKPSNIMVGAFGEVQVMDWGLAKRLGDGRPDDGPEQTCPPPALTSSTPLPAALTRPGAVVGTPGYLAPEQARGQAGDQRADVFGLGAILCEILTGAPPYRRGGLLDALHRAREADLSDGIDRLDRCGGDRELVRLAKDCLATEPAGRPADGSAVAARLAEYLAGVQERLRSAEVGQARAEARAEGERTRRRLAVGLAAAFLVMVALGGGTLLLVQHHRAEQAREQVRRRQAAESALARAADLKQQGRWAAALATLEEARQRLDERDEEAGREMQRAVRELQLLEQLEKVRLGAATVEGGAFARARADREYEAKFRAAGLGGPDEPPEAAAQRVRASGVRAALVAALDAWAGITEDRPRHDWALAVAQAADPDDDWGRRLRASWADPAALKVLAREAPVDRLSPHLLFTLASALNRHPEEVPLLRKAQFRYPGDFWLTFFLAMRLHEGGQNAEAVGLYRAALAIRPDTTAVLVNLGNALRSLKKLDEACDCYRRAIELDPTAAMPHSNLGSALAARGQLDEAIACLREAIKLGPTDANPHYHLGNVLQGQGRLDEAIACFRRAAELAPQSAEIAFRLGVALRARGRLDEAIACWRRAIELDPKLAAARTNLGTALQTLGRLDEAIACWRRAIELDPKGALPHYNLGSALTDKGQFDEAIACLRRAIALNPKYAEAHTNLGNALKARGQVNEAIACYRQAIDLDPKLARAHGNLGAALLTRGRRDEAIACFRKAIEIDPNFAEAHCNLGSALKARGDFAEALGAFRRGHEVGSQRSDWHHPSDRWARDCERLVEREKQLLGVLSGDSEPADARERIEWVRLCVQTRRYAAAARLSGEAFAADAKLADDLKAGHRYRAAAAAARAGLGQGRGAGDLTDEARAALRRRALSWLRADLALRAGQLESAKPADRVAARQALRNWQKDLDLAGLRDKAALGSLPAEEQKAFARLWAEVTATLQKDEKPTK